MSDLKQFFINEVLKPHTDGILGHTKAKVVKYDNVVNKASVLFQHPTTLGIVQLYDVPVQLGSGGFHSAGPFVGDDVWVQFDGGDLKRPKITSLADDDYKLDSREIRLKHERKGAYVPSCFSDRNNFDHDPNATGANKKPDLDSIRGNNVNDWAGGNGVGSSLYGSNCNPVDEINDEMTNAPYYRLAEPGVSHPKNNSIVKIKDNGMIHIFVDKDEGIVVDPVTKSVTIMTENLNEHVTNYTLLCEEGAYTKTKKDWTVVVGGNASVKCDNNITIEAKKEMYFKAEHITMEADRYDYL